MKTNHRCRWVRHRLPLLAGGELAPEERRQVERHVIGCDGCRGQRDGSVDALAALRRLAGESPSGADAPSLWPALALQIRRSRHVPARPSPWEAFLPRPWAFAGAATGLLAVLAASVARTTTPDLEPGPGLAPVVAAQDLPADPGGSDPPASPGPTRRGALPEAPLPRSGVLSQSAVKPIEPPSASLLFDYDLDHGTPAAPGHHDPQRTF